MTKYKAKTQRQANAAQRELIARKVHKMKPDKSRSFGTASEQVLKDFIKMG